MLLARGEKGDARISGWQKAVCFSSFLVLEQMDVGPLQALAAENSEVPGRWVANMGKDLKQTHWSTFPFPSVVYRCLPSLSFRGESSLHISQDNFSSQNGPTLLLVVAMH